MCRLFHDTLVPLEQLKASGIPIRDPGGFVELFHSSAAFPAMCPDRDRKLGCAHHGDERIVMGQTRSVNATSRMHLLNAIKYLRTFAPEIMDEDSAVIISKRIEELGWEIATLDVKMARIRGENIQTIQNRHDECVQELFAIAQDLEKKLQHALEGGVGYVTLQEAEAEYDNPYDI